MARTIGRRVAFALLAVAILGIAAIETVQAGIYDPVSTADGHPVFYIVIEPDGDIRPATAAERDAIDRAIADGTILRFDTAMNLARGPQ